MIEVIRTKDHPGYASDGLAVTVTHTLNDEHVKTVLRHAVEKRGLGVVAVEEV